MGRNPIALVSKTCGHRQADSGRIKPGSETVNSRVEKGRPAGSNELRVSPSPSKIPYGGFSLVRLQMDRQWRPSTRSQGLSAIPFVEGEKDRVRRHIGRDSESRYSNWAAFHFANSFDERYWGMSTGHGSRLSPALQRGPERAVTT